MVSGRVNVNPLWTIVLIPYEVAPYSEHSSRRWMEAPAPQVRG